MKKKSKNLPNGNGKGNSALGNRQKAIASGDLSGDENFTRYIDISTELFYYKSLLKGSNVFCPCDFQDSNFVKFFETSKTLYEINTFEHSGYDPKTQKGKPFQQSIPEFAKKHPNGIVVTNPPFSIITEFLQVCENNNLRYLFIGPLTFSAHRNQGSTFILNNKIWCGHTSPKAFILPDGTEKKYGNIVWYTNLMYKEFFDTLYLTYYMEHHDFSFSQSHSNILWVNSTEEIPIDYNGLIRVPMSYLLKHNPKQFKLIYCISDGSSMLDKNKKIIGSKKTLTPEGRESFMGFVIRKLKRNSV
jgi:hypothetical protein